MQAARAGVQGGGGGAGRQAGRPPAFTWPWGSGRCRREARSEQSALEQQSCRNGRALSPLQWAPGIPACFGDPPGSPRKHVCAARGPETRHPGRFGSCAALRVVLSALKRDRSSGADLARLPPAMMQLLGRFLVALALQTACAQQQDKLVGNRTAEVGVISFHDVWNRSSCQPIEKLVDIVSEYPREVEHMFSPSCVSLRRCSGCCGDERLQCVPTQTANITMQLLKMSSEEQAPYVELTFVEHRECVCRPRKGVLKLGRRRRPKGRSKRKWARQKLKD